MQLLLLECDKMNLTSLFKYKNTGPGVVNHIIENTALQKPKFNHNLETINNPYLPLIHVTKLLAYR